MILVTFAIFVVVVIVVLNIVYYGAIYGAEYQRISGKRLKKLIELGELNPSKVVLDLGAGFGRIMFKAAESGARVIGYEIEPIKVTWIEREIKRKLFCSYQTNLSIIKGNLLDADLSEADVVYCYLFGPIMQKVAERANAQMKNGALLISAEHEIKNWKPTYSDHENKIYVYTIGESNIG